MMKIKTGYLGNSNSQIHQGFSIDAGGTTRSSFFQNRDFNRAFDPQPVRWEGQYAKLYYWNWLSKRTPYNATASRLITHPGFVIRGKALVITGSHNWHQFRIEGDEARARALLSGMGLCDPQHVVFKPAGRHRTHTYIYVRDDNDAFAIRMRL